MVVNLQKTKRDCFKRPTPHLTVDLSQFTLLLMELSKYSWLSYLGYFQT